MNSSDGLSGSSSLHGRTAVVTGGAQGIGRAIAKVFQEAGARVCILDRDEECGQAAERELSAADPGAPVAFIRCDLESVAEIENAAEAIRNGFGTLDVLVNNAGIEIDRSFEETTPEIWGRIMSINLRAPFLLTRAVLGCFPEAGGIVINVSSIHATHAFPGSVAYACSKAGLVALTRNSALELAPRGIRVNAICPGYIDTRLWEEYLRASGDGQELAKKTAELHPVGRRGIPSDVAQAALFLATGGSSFITGTQLVVDGGLTIRAHP